MRARVSRIGVATQRRAGGPRGRRSGHPRDRTLRAVDDLLKANPDRVPWRPPVGIAPRISDAELVTLAVMQALLGFTSEARWLRLRPRSPAAMFPYLPQQPGYNKRLRKLAGTMSWLIRALGTEPACRRRRVDRRLHPGRVRPVPGDRQALGPGRLGRVRLLRLALPLLLGAAAAPAVHPARAADRRPRSPAPRPTNATSCSACSTTPT